MSKTKVFTTQLEADLAYDLFEVRQALERQKREHPEGLQAPLVRLERIEKYLKWIMAFVLFFTDLYLDQEGSYQKPNMWKWPRIVGAVGKLGLRLIGLKKII